MADVFISYKSERRPAARHLADLIEAHGFSVWFDYGLVPGKNFGRHIEGELRTAKAVVALWCPLSVASEWVQNEAALAKRLGRLVPARIAPCEPPLEFLRDDFVDITGWDGDPSSRQLDRLIDRIEALVGRDAQIDRRRLIELHNAWSTYGRPAMAQFALGPRLDVPDAELVLPDQHAVTITTNGFRNEMAGLARDIRAIPGPRPWGMIGGGTAAALAIVLAAGVWLRPGSDPAGLTPVTSTSGQARVGSDPQGLTPTETPVEIERRRVVALEEEIRRRDALLARLEADRKAE